MNRLLLLAALLSMGCIGSAQAQAQAQTQTQPSEDQTVHQRFACLQRERALEPVPPKSVDNNNNGRLRFKLVFESATKPPRIELLHGHADDDMERVARHYLEGYRLPCLHENDHPVEVVQEFTFRRWGHEPAVPLASRQPGVLVRRPKDGPHFGIFDQFVPGKALVEWRFVEGQDEPQIRFIFESVGKDSVRAIARYMRQLRLVDAAATPRPVVGSQIFVFLDAETKSTQYQLAKEEYKLLEFLRMTKNLREHLVDLDLNSMGCPFAVRISLRQPYDKNEVYEIDSHDPNRAYLIDWLSKLALRYKDEAQQKDLFGSDVRVTIPCGQLDLMKLAEPGAELRPS